MAHQNFNNGPLGQTGPYYPSYIEHVPKTVMIQQQQQQQPQMMHAYPPGQAMPHNQYMPQNGYPAQSEMLAYPYSNGLLPQPQQQWMPHATQPHQMNFVEEAVQVRENEDQGKALVRRNSKQLSSDEEKLREIEKLKALLAEKQRRKAEAKQHEIDELRKQVEEKKKREEISKSKEKKTLPNTPTKKTAVVQARSTSRSTSKPDLRAQPQVAPPNWPVASNPYQSANTQAPSSPIDAINLAKPAARNDRNNNAVAATTEPSVQGQGVKLHGFHPNSGLAVNRINKLSEDYEEWVKKSKNQFRKMMGEFKGATAADVCFMIDVSGSMKPWLPEVKNRACFLISQLQDCTKPRVAVVTYCDGSIEYMDFTDNLSEAKSYVNRLVERPSSGDVPEDWTAGYAAALRCKWRKDVDRLLVHFADAPPHGHAYHTLPDSAPGKAAHFETQLNSLFEGKVKYLLFETNYSTFLARNTIKEKYTSFKGGFASQLLGIKVDFAPVPSMTRAMSFNLLATKVK